MAITNTRVYPKQMDKAIDSMFFGRYAAYKAEFEQVAKFEMAPKGNKITEAELSPLGALLEIPEGDSVTFDKPEEGHEKERLYTKYGLGFQVTEEMADDDVFGHMKRLPSTLALSARANQEASFFDLFNSGFATHTSADGQYIFAKSDVHTTLKTGTAINNRPATDVALSETALQAAFEYYDGMVDEAGNPLQFQPDLLLAPTELRWTALKLWKNDTVIGSADNDLNTMNPGNGIVSGWRPFISRYLTSSTAWFLIAKEHDFRWVWKRKARLESADDFPTGNALFKLTTRYATFCNWYKGGYGTTGA